MNVDVCFVEWREDNVELVGVYTNPADADKSCEAKKKQLTEEGYFVDGVCSDYESADARVRIETVALDKVFTHDKRLSPRSRGKFLSSDKSSARSIEPKSKDDDFLEER